MKSEQEQSNPTPANINKQMLEIKKKIQLSEGQRKAAFEDCEVERKTNCEEIHKLKKEITELVKELKDKTQATAGVKVLSKRLERLVGPCEDKDVGEIKELLDLQIIDKSKALNLVTYKTKKRQKFLSELGKDYQTLVSQKAQKEVVEKVDKPTRKATCDLQNSIHAVEIQLREANHISVRYRDIKKSLMRDAARFESNIKKIEEQLEEQKSDINALQQVMNEATQKRGTARNHLLREEKLATAKANSRDRQTSEGRRLVTKRRQELELLEKRIFQVTKSNPRPSTGTAEDVQTATDDEIPETPSPPENVLSRAFEVLKQATGASSTEQVLQKFSAQRDTLERLIMLREKAEEEKMTLEKELEDLTSELEFYKYAEVKDSERKSIKMEQMQTLIDVEHQRSQNLRSLKSTKDKAITTILTALQDLHLCINPLAMPKTDILLIVSSINSDLRTVFEKIKNENIEDAVEENIVTVEAVEEKWLPAPYSGLVRRTPLPQPGASPAPPPPPGSDEEEEVPSRGYLKRQAQLVVDAKLRRKNVRLGQKRN
ncbi:uveal autoantigen with coiled-coil domains and ankyrin repeats [Zophobas morio]|uniref:uveal autoantigen with coiled-coil domains and ankyrin repeats n=1 Tax=Zophobas morio TaxID=2755281 RepID=UPI0030830993